MKKHLEMFLTMLKVGLFTFGGGYAMFDCVFSIYSTRTAGLFNK